MSIDDIDRHDTSWMGKFEPVDDFTLDLSFSPPKKRARESTESNADLVAMMLEMQAKLQQMEKAMVGFNPALPQEVTTKAGIVTAATSATTSDNNDATTTTSNDFESLLQDLENNAIDEAILQNHTGK